MLHDISSYRTGDSTDHAKRSALEAEKILTELGCFAREEISTACSAISNHSSKKEIHAEYDELLKDADVLQHYLYNTSFALIEKEKRRLAGVLEAFDVAVKLW